MFTTLCRHAHSKSRNHVYGMEKSNIMLRGTFIIVHDVLTKSIILNGSLYTNDRNAL